MSTERTPFPINIYVENERELYEAFTNLGVPMLTESQVELAATLVARRQWVKGAIEACHTAQTSTIEVTVWDSRITVFRAPFIAFLQDEVENINKALTTLGVAIEDPL